MPADASKRFHCSFNYSVQRYQSSLPLLHSSILYVCEENDAPDYFGDTGIYHGVILILVKTLCELPVNHRNIPASAFKLMTGLNGNKYYKVSYELELIFGSELMFKLVHEGRAIGSVTANYH